MGVVERYPDGTFCWVDLGTNDAAGAKAFYGGLFGWEFDDLPTGEQGTYSTCRLKGRAVAGLYDRAEQPAWGSYISVEDADRATAGRGSWGRRCWWSRSTRPGAGGWPPSGTRRGRSCRCRGRGSATGPRWSTRTGPGPGTSWSAGTWRRPGTSTSSCSGGRPTTCPRPIPRTAFTLGGLLVGGGHAPAPGEDPSPRWSVAFWVADADEAAARTQELGGTVLLPPMDIPVGRFTIVADPQGAVFTASAVPGGPARGLDGS